MARLVTDRENQGLASLAFKTDVPMKTPMRGKNMATPLRTGRKAFGIVNTQPSPLLNKQEKKTKEIKIGKALEANVKCETQEEDCPEIEKLIPYDPLEFEKYGVPEEFFCLSRLPLAGLVCPNPPLEEDPHIYIPPLPTPSPPRRSSNEECFEFGAFLEMIDELTEFPPEPESDEFVF